MRFTLLSYALWVVFQAALTGVAWVFALALLEFRLLLRTLW